MPKIAPRPGGTLAALALVLAGSPAMGAAPGRAPAPLFPVAGVAPSARQLAPSPTLLFALGNTGTLRDTAGLLFRPRAIAAGPDGRIYVADTGNHRVQEFTAEGELVRTWGTFGVGQGQFASPSGVAVAPDGTVVVADTGNSRLQLFTAEGKFLTEAGTPGSAAELLAPGAVAAAPNGRLYVADTGHDRVAVFTSDGAFLTAWGSTGFGEGSFDAPGGIAVAPDGVVIVADTGNERLQRFDSGGQFLSAWRGERGLGSPGAVSAGADGVVWSLDADTGRVTILAASGLVLGRGDTGTPVMAVGAGPSGSGYVADEGALYVMSIRGQVTDTLVDEESDPLSLPYASSMALAADGSVYLAMGGFEEIRHFTSGGAFLGRIRGTWTNEAANCLGPSAMVAAPNGDLLVSDVCGGDIERYGPDGSLTSTWSAQGRGPNQYGAATGLALGPDGSLYVADGENNRILRYDADGTFRSRWGGPGTGDGAFHFPAVAEVPPLREVGLDTDADGRLYVADAGNHRLQVFDATGAFITSWTTDLAAAPGGTEPTGVPGDVAVTSDGHVLVTDVFGGIVQVFSITGQLQTVLGDACALLSGGTAVCHPTADIDPVDHLETPAGADALADGTIVAADWSKVLLYRGDGLTLSRWGALGTGVGFFDIAAGGLAATQEGGVVAADALRSKLHFINSEGGVTAGRVNFVAGPGDVTGPRLAIPHHAPVAAVPGAGGAVFVAENEPAAVAQVSSAGFLMRWLVAPGEAASIVAVRPAPGGGVAVLAQPSGGGGAMELTVYTAAGEAGSSQRLNFDATGFALARDGTGYYIDPGATQLRVLAPGATTPTVWGRGGTVPVDFQAIADVAVGPAGLIYVTDSAADRVHVLTPAGTDAGSWGSPGSEPGQLEGPGALAVAADGTVWVADRVGTRLQAFGPARSGWRVEYFADRWLSGHPAAAERLESPGRDFGLAGPAPGVRPDGFSAAAERVMDLAGGRQTFHLSADGGARLWLDDDLVMDNWPGPHVEAVLRVDLTEGRHAVHLEFNDVGGASSFRLETPPDRGLPTPTPSATATATPLPTRPAVTPFPTPGAAPSLTITRLQLQAADLAYSPLSGLVYAAVGAGASDHAGQLVAIDPVAGRVVSSAAMGGDPTLLAEASDGSVLYVALAGSGKVRAYDVLAKAPDRMITVGAEGSTATDLAVRPGVPRALVAAVGTAAGHAAVVAFDGDRRLPVSLGPEVPSPRLAFADAAGSLFGHGNASAGLPIHVLRLDDQGVHLLRSVADLVSAPGADMTGAAGHLYFTTFQDIQATNLQESGRFPGANGRVLLPDPAKDAAYATWGGAVRIYRLGSHRGAGAIDVPGLGQLPHALVRWGVDGLAIADDEAVWLVRDPAVATGGRGTGRTAWLPLLIR